MGTLQDAIVLTSGETGWGPLSAKTLVSSLSLKFWFPCYNAPLN